MMKEYIMALDQGTTSSRCILFDHAGKIVTMAQKEFTQIYPQPGWVEQNPREIWSSQMSVAIEAMANIGASSKNIRAIGITNQRETTIVWDKKTGEPVYNAIVWQCRRTAEQIDELKEKGYGPMLQKRTGLVPDAYFSASKIAWILDHVKGAREAAEKGDLLFGTVDTWLIWNLTKGAVHVTDYTNAARTMLFDIHRCCWEEEILELFRIPKEMLPEVRPSSGFFGETQEQIFGGKIPVMGVAGDQQAALFGQCCFEKGDVKNTYGTGCFLLMHTGKEPIISRHGLLTTIAHIFSELYTAHSVPDTGYLRLKVLELLHILTRLKNREDVQQTEYFNQHQVECVKQAAALLTQELTVRRTIEQLAQEVGLSPTALKSCFKGIYGSSVYAYQKEYRLQLAQKLLLETDCTVAEIAHRVGYENPNKFSSAFREAAGMTPTEYRKMRPIG